MCKYCRAPRTATIFRERYRWRGRLSCGHVRDFGFVLPVEELERRGIINYEYEDPRIRAMKLQRMADHRKEQQEIEHFHTHQGTRGKMYL